MRASSAAILLALLSASSSGATDLYSVSREDAELRLIDRLTGATLSQKTLVLSPPAPIAGAWGLADDPLSQDRLWVVLDVGDELSRRLGIIDLTACTATECPVVDRGNLGDRFEGLASLCDGELYGVTGELGTSILANETLYRGLENCTPGTCSPILVQSLGNGDLGEAIAIAGYILFHASGSATQEFERLDLTTLMLTDLGIDPQSPVTNFLQASAMTADPTGTLLLAGQDSLFELSYLGFMTLVGSALDHTINGLAFLDGPCPTIFADGFESHSTGRWSSTAG